SGIESRRALYMLLWQVKQRAKISVKIEWLRREQAGARMLLLAGLIEIHGGSRPRLRCLDGCSSLREEQRCLVMSDATDPRLLTLIDLAHRCAQESDHFFNRQPHDPHYCFELFRRAIFDHDQRAWELIYTQYHRLVAKWVLHHADFPASGEDTEYFVNGAFEKMWAALTPD